MERAEMDQIPIVMEESGDERYEHELGEDIVEELMEKQPMARKPSDGGLTVDEGSFGEVPSQHCHREFLGKGPGRSKRHRAGCQAGRENSMRCQRDDAL